VKVDAAATPTPLVEGTLHVLGGTVSHEGRISWVPPTAEGSAALNAFVIADGSRGLVIDTSMPVFGDALVEQLKAIGIENLSILLTRPVEFDSMGNAEVLIRNFAVDRVYSELMFPPRDWVAFRDDEPLPEFEALVYRKGSELEVIPGHKLSLIDARLKLLACVWVYDAGTGTLFTSDSFSHVLAPEPGVQVVTAENDTTTFDGVMAHFMTKFDWLQGAHTSPLRRFLDEVFTTFDVQAIAPCIGCVIKGRDLVERHRRFVDEALRRLGEQEDTQ
jgi:flavorubredoxin